MKKIRVHCDWGERHDPTWVACKPTCIQWSHVRVPIEMWNRFVKAKKEFEEAERALDKELENSMEKKI